MENTVETVAAPKYAAKSTIEKSKSTVKKAAKKAAKKAVKKAAKKAVKKAVKKAGAPRKAASYTLTSRAKIENMGDGQRAAIAKLISKQALTRANLAVKLPDVPITNISWHLSIMVRDGLAKKVAA
jgi:hypothetical protein